MKKKSKQQLDIDNPYQMEQDNSYISDIDMVNKTPYDLEIEDSVDPKKDWNALHAYQAGYLKREDEYPDDSKDLRDYLNGWGIHKQKKGSYSCIGYAVTDMVYWHFVQKGYEGEPFSARFNWIAAKETDKRSRPTTFISKAGTTLKAGLDVCRKYGSVPDYILPNKKDSNFEGTPEQFYAIASRYKINSYYNLLVPKKSQRETQIRIWREWLLRNGPILVRIKMDNSWNTYKEGRIEKYVDNFRGKKHAVLIVAYDKDGFVVRNSWGEEWGEQGYATVSYEYALDAFDEAYGVIFSTNQDVGFPPLDDADDESFWDWWW